MHDLCGGSGLIVCHCGGDLCFCGIDGEMCPGCDLCEEAEMENEAATEAKAEAEIAAYLQDEEE